MGWRPSVENLFYQCCHAADSVLANSHGLALFYMQSLDPSRVPLSLKRPHTLPLNKGHYGCLTCTLAQGETLLKGGKALHL